MILHHKPLGRLLPNHVAEAFKTNLEQAGIKFALSTTVEKVTKINDGEDYEVTLATGQTLIADIVLSAIGLQPNISLAKKLQIFKQVVASLPIPYWKPTSLTSMRWVTVQN